MDENTKIKQKSPLREKQKQQLRSELISSTLELFEQNGQDFPSVDQIVEKAGVAKGTFYLYFESKADIIRAIVEECLNDFEAIVNKAIENPPPDANEALRKVITAQVDFFTSRPVMIPILMHGQGIAHMDLPKEVSEDFGRRFKGLTTAVFERIIRLGMLQQRYREVDAELAANMLFGIFAVLLLRPSDMPLSRAAETALDIIDRGIRMR